VMPPLDEDDLLDGDFVADELPPLRFAQRAFAAAASFARVAADIGRRRPSVLPDVVRLLLCDEEDVDPPVNRALIRSSNTWICSRSETASLSFSRDRSIAVSSLGLR
jgi:hypothetical protein